MPCSLAILLSLLTHTPDFIRADLSGGKQSFAHLAAIFIIGGPVQRRIDLMKRRIVAISLLLAAAIVMAACGTQPLPIPSPGAGGDAGSETPGEEATPEPETGITRVTGDI